MTWIKKTEEERATIYNKYLTKTVNTFRETLKEQLSNGERTFHENKDEDVIDNLTKVLKILLNSKPELRSTIIYPNIDDEDYEDKVELSNFLLSNTYSMNLNRPESFKLLGQEEKLSKQEDKLVFRNFESSNQEEKEYNVEPSEKRQKKE